jgi:transcriptional regulator with XRE-family HTH domain
MTYEDWREALSTRLHTLRAERGWTLQALADQIGSAPTTIANWEQGKTTPSAWHILQLAEAYSTPPGELLRHTPKRTP